MICFFFFQAEDGIRDVAVTGVQTCALPISRAGAHARPFEPHRHDDAAVIRGGEVERPLQQRVAEVPALEVDTDLEPRGADAVVVGIVDVEHQVECAAGDAQPGDVDRFEPEFGLLESEPAQGGAGETQQDHGNRETRTGKPEVSYHYVSSFPFPVSRSIRSFSCLQNSIRSAMVFSYPSWLGSYQRCPRRASGR